MANPTLGHVLTWNGTKGVYQVPSAPSGTITGGPLTAGVIPVATGLATIGDGYLSQVAGGVINSNNYVSTDGFSKLSIVNGYVNISYIAATLSNFMYVGSTDSTLSFTDSSGGNGYLTINTLSNTLYHSVKLIFNSPIYNFPTLTPNTYVYVNASGNLTAGATPLTAVPTLAQVLAAGNLTNSLSITSNDTFSFATMTNGYTRIGYLNAPVRSDITFSPTDLDIAFISTTQSGSIGISDTVMYLQHSVEIDFNAPSYVFSSPTPATVFSSFTPSTIVYSNSSKQLVSLANGSGVLTNNGSGTLTWGPGGGISGLTTNVIPVATSATTIGDGYLSQVAGGVINSNNYVSADGFTTLSIANGTFSAHYTTASYDHQFTIVPSYVIMSFDNTIGDSGYLSLTAVSSELQHTDQITFIAPDYNFQTLTASTVVYLDSSKNLVSLANGSGVLTNNGSGTLTWVAGGGINPTSTFIPYNNAGTFADSLLSQSGNTIILGTGGVGIDYGLTFNGNTEDGLLVWNEGDRSFQITADADPYYNYPGSTSLMVVTGTGGNENRAGFYGSISATANSGILTGFWGGYIDSGSSAFAPSIVVGSSGWNLLSATNTRTLPDVYAGQFTTEIGNTSTNLTITVVTGIETFALYAGTGFATVGTSYGLRIKDTSGANVTVGTNYGLYIDSITKGTTDYAIYTNSGTVRFGADVTVVTSVTTPLLIGGTSAGSSISYTATTGVGTVTGLAHQFTGGTNGASVIASYYNDYQTVWGSATHSRNSTAFGIFRVMQGTSTIDIGEQAGGVAGLWMNVTPSATNYAIKSSGSNTFFNSNGVTTISTSNTARIAVSSSTVSFTPAGATSGSSTTFSFTVGAATTLTASTEVSGLSYTVTSNKQWSTGNLALQREVIWNAPTYRAVGASVFTDVATTAITGSPIALTNMTFTNTHGLLIGISAVNGAGGAVTNSYGLTVNAQTGATNNYAAQFLGGNVGIRIAAPTAYIHLAAGTASANTAPLKLTSGTNLTTAETGAMEYNGTNLFFTRTGTTRQTVLTADVVTTEVVVSDTTITVNIAGTDFKLLARA